MNLLQPAGIHQAHRLLDAAAASPDDLDSRRPATQNLDEVRNLNLWGQDIDDCAIVASLCGVEVLSLSVNAIPSLRDFAVRALGAWQGLCRLRFKQKQQCQQVGAQQLHICGPL